MALVQRRGRPTNNRLAIFRTERAVTGSSTFGTLILDCVQITTVAECGV